MVIAWRGLVGLVMGDSVVWAVCSRMRVGLFLGVCISERSGSHICLHGVGFLLS